MVTGRGQADLTDLEQQGPYTRDTDAALLGIREDDEYVGDVEAAGIPVWPALTIAGDAAAAARGVLQHLERDELDGFWVHLDVDILDAKIMPAVDSPDPGGIDHDPARRAADDRCSRHPPAGVSTSASSTPTWIRTAPTPPSSPTPWWRPSIEGRRQQGSVPDLDGTFPDQALAMGLGSAEDPPFAGRPDLQDDEELDRRFRRPAVGSNRSCATGADDVARAPSAAISAVPPHGRHRTSTAT